MRTSRGQATVEYLAAAFLIALVLAGATVAIAAPDLSAAVVAKLRLAVCIVGGDICRTSDAAARGLDPCPLSVDERRIDNGVSFLFFRGGGTDFWSVERRSDGTVVLTQGYGQDLSAGTGIGLHLGPVDAGGTATGGAGFRSGRSWTLTEAQLRDLLGRVDPGKAGFALSVLLGEPDETFLEGGGSGSADLALDAAADLPSVSAEARTVLGRRRSRDGTSYYVDLGAGILDDFAGHVFAEYRTGDPPVITLRTADGDTETVMRLRLTDPRDRAVATGVTFLHNPALAIRDLVARIRARGTVERDRYRTREDTSGWDYAVELGVKLGADHARTHLRRDLVSAEVLNGPVPAERRDCIMDP